MDSFNYIGEFKDKNDVLYAVQITNDSSLTYTDQHENLVLGETPVIISTKSGDFLSPIKPRYCTVQIVISEMMHMFYTPFPQEILVRVFKEGDNPVVLFNGFVTPNSYSMDYTNLDTFEIEAVECISSLKDIDYKAITPGEPKIYQCIYIIWQMLKKALVPVIGYTSRMYVLDDITAIDGRTGNITDIYIAEANFFNDDEEKTPWKCYDVVEEILKYFGLSLVMYNNNAYLIDYRRLDANRTNINIKYASISASNMVFTSTTLVGQNHEISLDDYTGGTSQVELDDVYNKIVVSDNAYNIEHIVDEVIDNDNNICINLEREEYDIVTHGLTYREDYTTFLWVKKVRFANAPEHYSVFYRLNEDKSNWKHHFYKMYAPVGSDTTNKGAYGSANAAPEIINTGENEGKNYYDPDSTSVFTNSSNRFFNTLGVLPMKYSFDVNKSSVSWTDGLFFQMIDDTCMHENLTFFRNRTTYPVLEYESPEEIVVKPSSGTMWLTIKGDLWYQRTQTISATSVEVVYDTAQYGHIYATAPYDTEIVVYNDKGKEVTFTKEQFHTYFGNNNNLSIYCKRFPGTGKTLYNTGFNLWKMRVQIGDKYWKQEKTNITSLDTWWNKGEWTTTPTDFYIYYNNEPDGTADDPIDREECVVNFKWMKMVPNCVMTDNNGLVDNPTENEYIKRTGDNCYAIPICSKDNDAPLSGKIKITIYPPEWFPTDFVSLNDTNISDVSWNRLGPGVFCKDFEVGISYTDDNVWWIDGDNNDADIVYSNTSDKNNQALAFVNQYDITCRVNTTYKDKPISKSYVSSSHGLIKKIKNLNGDASKEQELNLIDKYYDHYYKPAIKYTFNTPVYYPPVASFYFTATGVTGNYYIDTQYWDIQKANNCITAVQYKSSL